MNELFCMICGVVFNLARIPTKYEPPENGWSRVGNRIHEHKVAKIPCILFEQDTGCELEGERALYATLDNHLAGPGCSTATGYSGYRITAEEMRDMCKARFILLKPNHATAQDDEASYEKDSQWFVSAITNRPPVKWGESLDMQCGLEKVRYGLSEELILCDACSHFAGREGKPRSGMPVHDPCWQMFMKVSKMRSGKVDIDGLGALWMQESCFRCEFDCVPRDREVVESTFNGFWEHTAGTEYLAANPVHIPALKSSVSRFFRFNRHTYAYKFSRGEADKRSSTDPFHVLPSELQYMLLELLDPADIANLRLASRTFRQLSNGLVKQKIRELFPWFWELNEIERRMIESSPIGKPPYWVHVGRGLRRIQQSCLGLRNRVRIWNACEKIVEEIARLRAQNPELVIQVDPDPPTYRETSDGPHCNRRHFSYIEDYNLDY